MDSYIKFFSSIIVEWQNELILCAVAFACASFGWYLIAALKLWIKQSSNPSALTYLPILSPVVFYGLSSVLYHTKVISSSTGDCATFFIMIGIILRLSVKSKNKESVRLAVYLKDKSDFIDVWLDSNDVCLDDAKQLIAKALEVQPSRVNIESGKGCYLKDVTETNAAFLPQIVDAEYVDKDLFGFSTVPCFVTLTEEEETPAVSVARRSSLSRVFPTLDGFKNTVKYGHDLVIQGKIPNSANDAKAFSFSIVNKFAAVAPTTTQTLLSSSSSSETVRLCGWREDSGSDQGKAIELYQNSLAGQKVKNGECVVIEKDGHFMSVSKGWYVSWHSDKPRRSGAFFIEVVKKAPQSILGHGKDIMKEKVLKKERDDESILKPGDVFRLRSVKFPSYELGVTSVRLKDDHFHIGLRKIGEQSTGSDWCLPLHLTAKMH